MRKKILPVILMLTMGLSLSVYAEEATSNAPAESEEQAETTTEEAEGTSKSAHLLAKGYELMEGLTIPVGTTNADLDAETLEPENAEKVSIDGAQGEGSLNLYVFRPAEIEDDEITPVIYYIHGGGYQFGNTGMFEAGIQALAAKQQSQ